MGDNNENNFSSADFERLQYEELNAITQTEKSIEQMEKFRDDYLVLKNRLKTLPDRCSYDILVPFGPKAFMPGQMVHTNEILVLLGDNWFAERSAMEASQIIDRRVEEIDKQIKDLKKQNELLKPRVRFTDELKNLSSQADGVFEIKEDYNDEKEMEWKKKHKENVRNYYAEKRLKEKQMSMENAGGVDVWELLGKLEEKECENKELTAAKSNVTNDLKGDEESDIEKNVIMFKHTHIEETKRQESSQAKEKDINSPADIYQRFYSSVQSKKEISDKQLLNKSDYVMDEKVKACAKNTAFSGAIVERESSIVEEKVQNQPKKVSKFKQGRMSSKTTTWQ